MIILSFDMIIVCRNLLDCFSCD